MIDSTYMVLLVVLVLLAVGIFYYVFNAYAELVAANALHFSLLQEIKKHSELEHEIGEIKGSVQKLYELHEAMGYEIHAVAAHFVPRLRREYDVSQEDSYQQEVECGHDPESKFHQEISGRDE